MRTWKKITAGFMMGLVAGLTPVAAWAEPSPNAKSLIAEHRLAAADARKRATFHEEMSKNFVAGRGGGKIDMVGHCAFWADYYRKLADKEERAAQELE